MDGSARYMSSSDGVKSFMGTGSPNMRWMDLAQLGHRSPLPFIVTPADLNFILQMLHVLGIIRNFPFRKKYVVNYSMIPLKIKYFLTGDGSLPHRGRFFCLSA